MDFRVHITRSHWRDGTSKETIYSSPSKSPSKSPSRLTPPQRPRGHVRAATMATTTPTNFDESQRSLQQSSSKRTRSQTPPPRPTTPLRPPSRSSLRSSQTPTHVGEEPNPLDGLEPAFAELADGMADLEANFMHLQLMHESLARFNECFAGFLHGLKVNAFCVDFPEAPIPESFRRAKDNPRFQQYMDESSAFAHSVGSEPGADNDLTFLTTDTSFVDNPPASSAKASTTTSRPQTPRGRGAPPAGRGMRGASGVPRAGAGVGAGRGRASGLARATGRARGGWR